MIKVAVILSSVLLVILAWLSVFFLPELFTSFTLANWARIGKHFGPFGDVFNVVTALFNGLALAAISWSLYYQRKDFQTTLEHLEGTKEDQKRQEYLRVAELKVQLYKLRTANNRDARATLSERLKDENLPMNRIELTEDALDRQEKELLRINQELDTIIIYLQKYNHIFIEDEAERQCRLQEEEWEEKMVNVPPY